MKNYGCFEVIKPPTSKPSSQPSARPSSHPSARPSSHPSSKPSYKPSSTSSNSNSSIPVIVGTTVGILALILMIAGAVYIYNFKKQNKRRVRVIPVVSSSQQA